MSWSPTKNKTGLQRGLAAGIQLLRPRVVAATCTPADLEWFEPQVVDYGASNPPDPDVPAWVGLSAEPRRPARARVGVRRRENGSLPLEGLLRAVNEAEELVRAWGASRAIGDPRPGKGQRIAAAEARAASQGRADRPRGTGPGAIARSAQKPAGRV